MAKVRSGFVSNSSSSSFIIGLGVVGNVDTYKCMSDAEVITIASMRENDAEAVERYNKCLVEKAAGTKRYCWSPEPFIRKRGDKEFVRVTAFDYSEVSLDITGLPEDASIAILQTSGELDGDYDFCEDEDDYEPNYDLSPTEGDEEVMDEFADGLTQCEVIGGAGRNG